MTTAKSKSPTYRITLTAEQLYHIDHLARSQTPISNKSIELIGKLAPTIAKIEAGSLKAAYVAKGTVAKKDIAESLGIPDMQNTNAIPAQKPANLATSNSNTELALSKDQVWEAAYNKYASTPELCSAQDIYNAKEHMYLNGLMSPEEVVEWENFTS